MLDFLLAIAVVTLVTTYMGWQIYQARHLSKISCAAMVDQMRYINYSEVCFVAGRVSNDLTPQVLIDHLGGLEGLDRLRFNAGIMIKTAKYLALIDPEGKAIAKQMRQDAMEVRKITLLVVLQHYLKLERIGLSTSMQQLSKLYIATTVRHLKLCDRLVSDVLQLTRLTTSIHGSIIGASNNTLD